MHRRKKGSPASLLLFVGLFLAVAVVLIISLLQARPEKIEEYRIDEDAVPSITLLVGERQLLDSGREAGFGLKTLTYHYEPVSSARDDVARYVTHLQSEEGFLFLQDWDALEEIPGAVYLGRESEQELYLFTVTINYWETGYQIVVEKTAGQLL